MLEYLRVCNFTVFAEAKFDFGPGLNVVVGTNGTGKSHVLKLGYALLYNYAQSSWDRRVENDSQQVVPRKETSGVEEKLANVFQPVPFQAGELSRRRKIAENEVGSEIRMGVTYPIRKGVGPVGDGVGRGGMMLHLEYGRSQPASATYLPTSVPPWPARDDEKHGPVPPVFIPAKEVLTLSWLLPLYGRYQMPVDETYPDLLRQLALPPLKSTEPGTEQLLEKLRQLMGGKIEEEGGRYFLSASGKSRLELNMVAEGLRKFAILYRLLVNGTLTPRTTLFWDEPEANLNPALLREMAVILVELVRAGFQIILATHSLFLLKEFHILAQRSATAIRYFGLSALAGEPTTVAVADDLEQLPDIMALDAELEQSERFQRVLDQEDADRS